MNDRIIIFDTTLRDGEQAPGASMTIDEKVELAHQLARLGVDVIEAGFPVSSPAQREAVRRIVAEVGRDTEGPTICALARTVEADVEAAGEALAGAPHTRIHTFVPTSDVHLKAKFDDERYGATLAEKRDAVLRMTRQAVEQAGPYTDDVEFSAEDAGRTDPAFLAEVVRVAVDAGATTINIPDTTGYCTPEEYAALFEKVRASLGDPGAVVFSTHCHDDLGLALANSLAGVRAGARQVECTINGIGERAGNAALEEVVMALRVREDHFGLRTGIDATLLSETSRLVSVSSGFAVQPNKAIVGKNAFCHEAGIHQHGVLKERATYEIMRAEDVGQSRAEQIRLGRHSGRAGLFSRLEKMGLHVPKTRRQALYERFLDLADRKKEVFEDDLRRLAAPAAGDAAAGDRATKGRRSTKRRRSPGAAHYALDHLSVTVGTGQPPEALVQVACREDGTVRSERATGDGPVDAIYRALDHAAGEPHDLVDYTIRAVSEGSGAQGEVSVTLRYGAAHFSGRATDTDVLRASAHAYLDALNQLAASRVSRESVEFVTHGIMQSFG